MVAGTHCERSKDNMHEDGTSNIYGNSALPLCGEFLD